MRRNRHLSLLGFSALLIAAGAVSAQQRLADPTDTSDPAVRALQNVEPGEEVFGQVVPASLRAEIEGHLRGLASPEYAARLQSTDRLIGLGSMTFPVLREVYYTTDDLEVRQRIEKVVFEAFLNHMVRLDDWGYLGIQGPGSDGYRLHEDDTRIPRGKVGLSPYQVLPDTPAHRAGLQVTDVIIALDGDYLDGGPASSFGLFATRIRKKGPGATATLTVLRADQTLELNVVLARPSLEQLSNMQQTLNIQGLREAYDRALLRFGPWWQRHFAAPPPTVTGEAAD